MSAEITLDCHVCASPDVVSQILHDEAVLLNLKSGIYFGLDATGTFIWQFMAKGESLRIVLNEMLRTYDVSAETCTADLLQTVDTLARHGLIEISK